MSSDTPDPVIGSAPPKADVLLSSEVYDWVKRFSLFILPALAAAYFGLAQIWGLGYAEQVVGTVAVLETLLGVVIRVSQKQYDESDAKFDGSVILTPDYEAGETAMRIQLDPAAVQSKKELTVKVENG